MEGGYKRVNVMIVAKQYRILSEQGLNVSGLIRDLIGDHLSENVITLQVSEETRHIYNTVISNTGSNDQELSLTSGLRWPVCWRRRSPTCEPYTNAW